jgi:hypothetical protein
MTQVKVQMTQVKERPPTPTPAAVRGASPVRALVLDIAAPIAVYYGIRAAGGSVWLALAAGGVIPAVSTIAGLITRRRVNVSGAVMLAASRQHRVLAHQRQPTCAARTRRPGHGGLGRLPVPEPAGQPAGHLHHLPGPARRAARLRLRDPVLGPADRPVLG